MLGLGVCAAEQLLGMGVAVAVGGGWCRRQRNRVLLRMWMGAADRVLLGTLAGRCWERACVWRRGYGWGVLTLRGGCRCGCGWVPLTIHRGPNRCGRCVDGGHR